MFLKLFQVSSFKVWSSLEIKKAKSKADKMSLKVRCSTHHLTEFFTLCTP